jgi:signal transduction histidine kinase
MKSDFVSNVSHELRTPLASIKGFAATILDDEEMPAEVQREFVGIINDESDKLIVIINDILDVSKIMAGRMHYDLQVRPVERTVEQVVALLGIQARSKGLDLVFELVDPAQARFDTTRLSQVLTNLVGNALKFTDRGGVQVSQWVADGEVHLAIGDTGIGISAAQLPHIFDKFYRVENVVHTKEGTGLGLALVRTIVEHHGGRIEVQSEEGQGSTFTVRLPLAHQPQQEGA